MTLLTPDSSSPTPPLPHHHNHDHQQPPSKPQGNNEGIKTPKTSCSETVDQVVNEELATKEVTKVEEDTGRERLKRHRIEVAGRVWIPDIWGQEEMLKDWVDCSAFDACLVSSNIMSARAALVKNTKQRLQTTKQLTIS